MAIRKVPDNTWCFKFCNANPKNNRTGDCYVRAISIVISEPWETTFKGLASIALEYGLSMGDEKAYSKYLESKGFIRLKTPRKSDNKRYTGVEFAYMLQKAQYNGSLVAHIGTGHVTAMRAGVFYDIWDCSDGAIGIVWVPREDIETINYILLNTNTI